MSFVHSAQDVRLDDGHTLRAKLQNGNGDWVDAEFDLNQGRRQLWRYLAQCRDTKW